MALKSVMAQLPGIFYRQPSPGQPEFVKEGDTVVAGDTVGIIEVMKTFNAVAAEEAGRIVRFLVENEEAVMAGDPLYEIEV